MFRYVFLAYICAVSITGSASGDNDPYTVDTNVVEATGTGSVTYDPPQP